MISVAIMGHPKRRRFIKQLRAQLPDAPVVLDQKNDRWDTGRRSILAYDPKADFHVVVQDDAVLCRDFLAGCGVVAKAAGQRPVALYMGRTQARQALTSAAKRALRRNTPWVAADGPYWGVAVILPVEHIPDLIRWCDTRGDIANYDARIAAYYKYRKIDCWYTVPSLVNHREVKENPSLIAGRSGNRTAFNFIAADRSPLQIRWHDKDPVRVRKVDGVDQVDTMTQPRRSARYSPSVLPRANR